MLDEKDLEMIAKTIRESNEPILEEMKKLENKVTEVQMTLENETNKEIRIIAEGHLDLSRKLDDALKVENEKEMLLRTTSSCPWCWRGSGSRRWSGCCCPWPAAWVSRTC